MVEASEKEQFINTITRTKAVATNANITGMVAVPDIAKLKDKSLEELRNLGIHQVQWESSGLLTLGFTLTDGESCKSGATRDFECSHTFDQSKKITRIKTIIHSNENDILQINFFAGEQLLCKLGCHDDDLVKYYGVKDRVVTFEIAADEQLIGCELYNGPNGYGNDFFKGVTWMKWKIPK